MCGYHEILECNILWIKDQPGSGHPRTICADHNVKRSDRVEDDECVTFKNQKFSSVALYLLNYLLT